MISGAKARTVQQKLSAKKTNRLSVKPQLAPVLNIGEQAVPVPIQAKSSCACGGFCPSCKDILPVQTKLKVGEPNDKYEKEADTVADQVMRMPAAENRPTQSLSAPEKIVSLSAAPKETEAIEDEEEMVQPMRISPQLSAQGVVQRQGDGALSQLSDLDEIGVAAANITQRKSTQNSGEASTQCSPEQSTQSNGAVGEKGSSENISLNPAILSGGGQPLPDSIRGFYEERFGRDFSSVYVHTGSEAAEKNSALNSYAFTHANHIWLGKNQRVEPSSLLAHELTHVVQQTQPGVVQRKKQPKNISVSEAAIPGLLVQRFGPFWEPKKIKNGQVNHNKILPVMGKENSVFTEAPVPNADRLGSALEGDKKGEADFYGASTTVGLRWEGYENPKHLNARGKIKKSGKKYTGHDANSAPYIGTDDELLGSIGRAANAPNDIQIADLKPSEKTVEANKGVDQVNHYRDGFLISHNEYNEYAKKYPHRVSPNGQKWGKLEVGFFENSPLAVPEVFKWPLKKSEERSLVIKQGSSKNVIFEPKKPIKGHLYVSKDSSHTGIWNYFWWPKKKIAKSDLVGLDNFGKTFDKEMIKYVMQAPVSTAPKLKPGKSPVSVTQRENTSVLQRKGPKAKKIKETDPFDHGTWKTSHKKYTGLFKALDEDSSFPAFKGMMQAIDVQQRLKHKVDASIPEVPANPKEDYTRYKKADFWTGESSKPIGKMRHWFGEAFVKVAKVYNGIREKLQSRLKGKTRRGVKSGILGSALNVAFKLLKLVGAVVVRKTMNELVNSLISGVQKKLKAILDPEKLLELLLDDERKAELDEKVKEIKAIQKAIEEKVSDTADKIIEKIIGPYASHLETIENVQKIVSDIVQVVSLVRWGARVIACLSPPAWGCLWILAEAVLSEFAALVIKTCWFQEKITPLINKVGFIKELPKFLAGKVIEKLREHVLPPQLHDVFADPSTMSVGDVSFDEIECDESSDGQYPLTPEREELMKLQERLGEEKFKRLMALIQAGQIPSDKKLTVEQIKKLGEFADKATIDELKRYAHNYNKAPKGGIIDLKTFLDSVAKGGEASEPASGEGEKPAPESDEEGASEEGGIPVVDGEQVKVVNPPPNLNWNGKAVGLVLNPRWKHHYSESTIYRVDVRFYKDNFQGEPIFIIRNVETKVMKDGRSWLGPEEKRTGLRIIYTTQFMYYVDPTYLQKGGKCVGVVDASGKF